MVPSIGRIVIYHFEREGLGGTRGLVSRPAIVISVTAAEASTCELHVFFSHLDGALAIPPSTQALRVGVKAHHEGGEIGVIEVKPPEHHTWSWPKRV